MTSSIICDYITLFIEDAYENGLSDFANGVAVWDIPEKSFYFKDRGSVCLMSMVSSGLPSDYGENITLMTQQGYNGFTSQENSDAGDLINADLAVMGSYTNFSGDPGGSYLTEYTAPETIKLLTAAKPRQIRFVFFKNDKTTFDLSADSAMRTRGHITLKFEYIDPEILREGLYGVEYKPAF
tara:strand:- start:1953 stop:2498 length:546 start_codon:yes stop_codon:yes gene_type:complete